MRRPQTWKICRPDKEQFILWRRTCGVLGAKLGKEAFKGFRKWTWLQLMDFKVLPAKEAFRKLWGAWKAFPALVELDGACYQESPSFKACLRH